MRVFPAAVIESVLEPGVSLATPPSAPPDDDEPLPDAPELDVEEPPLDDPPEEPPPDDVDEPPEDEEREGQRGERDCVPLQHGGRNLLFSCLKARCGNLPRLLASAGCCP